MNSSACMCMRTQYTTATGVRGGLWGLPIARQMHRFLGTVCLKTEQLVLSKRSLPGVLIALRANLCQGVQSVWCGLTVGEVQ
jgi:hypothetical protein